jgi:hypothetical protein
MIYETKPEYLLNLSWNLKDEIMAKMAAIQQQGAKFVVPIPEVAVYNNQAGRVVKLELYRTPASTKPMLIEQRGLKEQRGLTERRGVNTYIL